MSNTNSKTPTRSTEPTAPDYAVPDPQEAWERLDRLVSKVIEAPKDSGRDNFGQRVSKKTQND